jgi:hypothetical protein
VALTQINEQIQALGYGVQPSESLAVSK